MRWLLALALVAWPFEAWAQERPHQPPATPPPALQFDETVDVIGITPIHGLGLDRLKVPANVQVLRADHFSATTPDLPAVLAARATSVHSNDAQAGMFQPDVLFRGFTGSPLLGASEGLAVYQNGVRLNEGFGDTVNWDALPAFAIASLNVIPGSNPLFGLNALGGALSIRTKDGFEFPGARAAFTTGAFGRQHVHAEAGGHRGSTAFFLSGGLLDESGWRDASPSTTRQFFGDVAWRGAASRLNLNLTAASNDLTGNGPAPIGLLALDRRAVFTHPDRTDNDMTLLTVGGQRHLSSNALVETVGYYRHTNIGTFNGDAAEPDAAAATLTAINNVSTTRGRAAGVSGQLTRTTPFLERQNHFIAGAGLDAAWSAFEFASEFAHLTDSRGTTGTGLFDDDAFVNLRTRTATASAFATNTWTVHPALNVTVSARFNWTRVRLRDQIATALNGDHAFRRLNPAAGLTYHLHNGMNLYASYAQSSRVPTPVELTCADPEDPCRLPNAFVSDPPLDQIVATTWEGGVRRTVAPLTWSLSAFDTASEDDIIFISSGTLRGEGHFENVARTRRRGIEATGEYTWGNRVSAFATYTWQRATFGTDLLMTSPFHPDAIGGEIPVEAGADLPGVPAHTAKFGASGSIAGRVTLSGNVLARSGQYLRGDEANLLARIPGFAVVDVRATHRLTGQIAIVAHVHNVLDARYATFGVLGDASLLGDAFEDEPRFDSPGAPRAGWIGLEVRF